MIFYFTHDSDGETILEDAQIDSFDCRNEEEFKQTIIDEYAGAFWLDDDEKLTIIKGDFSDCWIKTNYSPNSDLVKPFNLNDVIDYQTNPGRHKHWLTPVHDVYVFSTEKK